jgi:S1-C subfamily serine protease
LGIDFQDLDPALREVMGLPSDVRGALVNRVHPAGPAEKAGVQRGDVVAKLDGRRLGSARQLFEMLETVTPNQLLKLELWRDGHSVRIDVVAEQIPDNVAEELAKRLLGLRLEPRANGGYVVDSVRPSSPGARIGLARGDLILAINGVTLQNAESLRRATLNLRGRERALVVVQRGPGRYHLTIPLH